jgi:uncharacterized protein YkwD
MRPKARLLLLLVVIPALVLGAVVAVGRTLLDGDGGDAANTVALSESPPPEAAETEAPDDPEPTADKKPKETLDDDERSSPTKASRAEAQRSKPSETTKSSQAKGSGTTSTSPTFAGQVIKLTNKERAKVGCKALKSNSLLKSAAQKHSADMAKKDYFSHTGKDGRSPFDRMTDAGYAFSAAAENIAAGQRTPGDVVEGWMNSEGHKKNILNCTYTEIGVGYAKGGSYGTYWTQNFGKPA